MADEGGKCAWINVCDACVVLAFLASMFWVAGGTASGVKGSNVGNGEGHSWMGKVYSGAGF